MLIVAFVLFMISLAIFLFGIEEVFTGKRFPDDMDTPCMLAFLVLGIIFLNIGVIYRDMSVHPEFFEDESGYKDDATKKREEWEIIKERVKLFEKDFLVDSKEESGQEKEGADEDDKNEVDQEELVDDENVVLD